MSADAKIWFEDHEWHGIADSGGVSAGTLPEVMTQIIPSVKYWYMRMDASGFVHLVGYECPR